MKLPTIYKLTNGGKVQEWTIEIDEVLGSYRTVSGQVSGKLTTSAWTDCVAKNEGKANATTCVEQAILEATAKRTLKLKKGYTTSIDSVDDTDFQSPMLAATYADGDVKSWPVWASNKYDGLRCIGKPSGLFSRNNSRFHACPHIETALKAIFDQHNVTLDGELYNHDYRDNFDKITSLVSVNNTSPTTEELEESARIVEYHVYDLIDLDNPASGFVERYNKLQSLIADIQDEFPFIKLAPSYTCHNQAELDDHFKTANETGYEGQCIRTDAPYTFKRAACLLKRKDVITEEFPLLRVVGGKGKHATLAARAWVKLPNGNECKVGINGSHELLARIYHDRDKLVASQQLVTCEYQNYTPKGMLRFGKIINIRDYE